MTNEQAIECGDLRVVFRWRGDRYGHTIERRIDGQWTPLLESVEGLADIRDDWPPSPVLQNLHFEAADKRPGSAVGWSRRFESLVGERGDGRQ